MSDVILDNPARFDTPLLAERYDQISDSQFENGMLLINELGVKSGDHVLDIGCGTGRLGEHVLKTIGENGHYIGLDPSEHRIKIAQQKVKSYTNASFELGSESNISHFAENSFDVVYLNFVFHHGPKIIKLNHRKNNRHYTTPWDVIESIEASDFGNYLSQMPERLRDSVMAEIVAKLGKYKTEKGLEFTGHTIYVITRKPLGDAY